MFFDSLSSQAMQKSMDALWLKMRVHSDNLANIETPGYKAKKVAFGEVLKKASSKEGGGERLVFRTTITADTETEARVDGNNVSAEKEQLELWKAEAQYAYLVQKISGEYSNLRNIISQVGR